MAHANPETRRAYAAQHYQKNKALYQARARVNRKKQQQARDAYLRDLKGSTPCADCGQQYPYYVMDFDHLRDKVDSVARMKRGVCLERIIAEAEKCEIVCSNCHRARTWRRAGIGIQDRLKPC